MDSRKKTLGEWILHLRSRGGLDLHELAPVLGITRESLGNIENGKTRLPRKSTMINLAGLCGFEHRDELTKAVDEWKFPHAQVFLRNVTKRQTEMLAPATVMKIAPSSSDAPWDYMNLNLKMDPYARAASVDVPTLCQRIFKWWETLGPDVREAVVLGNADPNFLIHQNYVRDRRNAARDRR